VLVDASSSDRPRPERDITLSSGSARLGGTLTVPDNAHGLVVFTHGSGSSRHSPRGRYVAAVLNGAGLGTLLFDLLTPEEERHRRNVFDIGLLAGRLLDVTSELQTMPGIPRRLGYFGASTGAAAALYAAADQATPVAAIVSRGGRPDLAGPKLAQVRAPTLLIVGGLDHTVIEFNRAAQSELRCENQLQIVPGATHLFEEPGTLDAVAHLARSWFTHYLAPNVSPA
jgi:putative phosphoribosyl transferase